VDQKKYILTAESPANSGIVAALAGLLAQHDCYIHSLEQFDDDLTKRFFFRCVFSLTDQNAALEDVTQGLTPICERFKLVFHIFDPLDVPKVMILVSKQDHCLDDLLYRRRTGELAMDITAVVSNHKLLAPLVEREGLEFVYLPVSAHTKAQQEQQLLTLVQQTNTELVVLARYMQILSNELCQALAGRCINIHHSFLPGFKGAKAYHQAYERGVKYIGATAHYVNSELDEGPIIEQTVTRVDHNFRVEELVRVGRDNECIALARAVKNHLERRVFLDGHKTIVFQSGHY